MVNLFYSVRENALGAERVECTPKGKNDRQKHMGKPRKPYPNLLSFGLVLK
jgi:hypothetical protein